MSVRFQNILVSKIYQYQRDDHKKINDSLDYIFESVKTFLLQLHFDSDIAKLRNLDSPELNEINTATRRLSTYGTIISNIKSIYIYNDVADTFYVTIPNGLSRTYKGQAFFDTEIRNVVQNPDKYPTLYPIPRNIPIANKNDTVMNYKGFTFLFHNQRGGGRLSEGAIQR